MYQRVINAIREDVLLLLKEQVQGVFLPILETTDFFNNNALDRQRSLSYATMKQWIETLEEEIYKVRRFEVTFVVAGTMKAGKSTMINAIVGTEVLPNRNRPMTTLPTVIRHRIGKSEPELLLYTTQPLQSLIAKLCEKLQEKEANGQIQQMAFCATEDGRKLVSKLLEGSLQEISQSYKGNEEIYGFLNDINDIWRLCNMENINVDEYLQQYNSIEKFPVIEVEFFHLRDQSMEHNSGGIALIDTPGPNEAGQTFLKGILKEQMEKASGIIAVLDYTQLNAEADAEIRRSLSEIENITKDRLFVLVNKMDQRDRNGMDIETLRSYVAKQLFEERVDTESVFPVSSSYAYLAKRALNELFVNGNLPDYRFHPWVGDFGRLAMGSCWEKEIGDLVEVKNRAAKLWQNSLFDQPLTEIIKKGSENAAIMSLKSALIKMLLYDKKIIENIQFRQNAFHMDANIIGDHIKSFEKDIYSLKEARNDVQVVINESTTSLQNIVQQMFDERESVLKKEIQAALYYNTSSDRLSRRLEAYIEKEVAFDPTYYSDFATEKEAREFLDKLIGALMNTLQQMEQTIGENFNNMADGIWQKVNNRLESVLTAAAERLHEAFHIKPTFPVPKVRFALDFDRLHKVSIRKDSNVWVGAKRERKWYTLWCREHEVTYKCREQVYRIYIEDVVAELQQLLKEDSNGMWELLEEFVSTEFKEGISTYFDEVADYLEIFRGNLVDSIHDKEMESKQIENLQHCMSILLENAVAHRDKVQVLGEGIPDEMLSRMERVAG